MKNGIPENDEEVKSEIMKIFQDDNKTGHIAINAMFGIYKCRRALGDDIIQAYEYALESYLKKR